MKIFTTEARLHLPDEAPGGTLVKIPIDKITGQCPSQPVYEENENYDFYKFIKTSGKWIYLGIGRISEKHRQLYRIIEK